jgi:periplasmic copper chaperone A
MTYRPQKAVLYGLAAGLVLLSVQLLTTSGRASDYRIGSIVITQPWARATPKGASTGAAYMTITNTGSAPDRVSCVSSDASAECQIHIMAMDSGVMKMRRVEGGLEIKPNETAAFKPSGLHLMLVHLKHPLDEGKTVKVTLKFNNAGTVEVGYPSGQLAQLRPIVLQAATA